MRLALLSVTALAVVFFDNAPDMLVWLDRHLAEAALLCLDHDLGPSRIRESARFEPGTGRDVADFLAGTTPRCPVLIHTRNYHAAPGMIYVLERAGWRVERVIPIYDLEWVELSWLPAVMRLL